MRHLVICVLVSIVESLSLQPRAQDIAFARTAPGVKYGQDEHATFGQGNLLLLDVTASCPEGTAILTSKAPGVNDAQNLCHKEPLCDFFLWSARSAQVQLCSGGRAAFVKGADTVNNIVGCSICRLYTRA